MDANPVPEPSHGMAGDTAAIAAIAGPAKPLRVTLDDHSWSAFLPAMLAVLQDGGPTGRRLVIVELRRMAAAADLCNQALIALVRLNNRADADPDIDAKEVIERARQCQANDQTDPLTHIGNAPITPQTGLMAKRLLGKTLELQVCYSAAGFYLGTYDRDMPCTRESVEYWRVRELATRALESGQWTQRDRP